jgi:hypothetical protein
MKEFIRIGVDLGKNYFQVHALESEDGGATTRKLSRQATRKLFSETRPCLAGQALRYGSLWFGPPEPGEGIGRANFRRWATRCA